MPHDTPQLPRNAGTVAARGREAGREGPQQARNEGQKEGKAGTDPLYALRLKAYLSAFAREGFAFWMICGYLLVEYVRPQSIIKGLDILPWGQITLILALGGIFVDKQRRWVGDPVNKYLVMFLGVIVLSCANAVYPNKAWPYLFDYFSWLVIYFLIINTVNTRARLMIFIAIFLIASFKLSLFGARTWATRGFGFTTWGIMGPPGFFQNSGELSIQMLIMTCISFYLAQFLRPHISKLKYYIFLLFPLTASMTVIGASSRGSQIGLAYLAYRGFLKERLAFKTIVLGAIVIGAGWALLPDEQKARFAETGTDQSSQQRLLYWQHGIEMVKDHPFLGIGYYNFAPYYEAHFPEDMLYEFAQLPHNIFIQVATDTGLTGLLIYLMIIYRNFRSTRDVEKLCEKHSLQHEIYIPLAKGLRLATWGFVIAGQFVSVVYYPFLWINLAFAVCLHNIVERATSKSPAVSTAVGRPLPA